MWTRFNTRIRFESRFNQARIRRHIVSENNTDFLPFSFCRIAKLNGLISLNHFPLSKHESACWRMSRASKSFRISIERSLMEAQHGYYHRIFLSFCQSILLTRYTGTDCTPVRIYTRWKARASHPVFGSSLHLRPLISISPMRLSVRDIANIHEECGSRSRRYRPALPSRRCSQGCSRLFKNPPDLDRRRSNRSFHRCATPRCFYRSPRPFAAFFSFSLLFASGLVPFSFFGYRWCINLPRFLPCSLFLYLAVTDMLITADLVVILGYSDSRSLMIVIQRASSIDRLDTCLLLELQETVLIVSMFPSARFARFREIRKISFPFVTVQERAI